MTLLAAFATFAAAATTVHLQRELAPSQTDVGVNMVAISGRISCLLFNTDVRCWGKDPDGHVTGNANNQASDVTGGIFSRQENDFECTEDQHLTGAVITFDPPDTIVADREVPAEIGMFDGPDMQVACTRFLSGGVRCWGKDGSSLQGGSPRFGAGVDAVTLPAAGLPARSNIAFPAGSDGQPVQAVSLVIGSYHACIINTVSDMYCWGGGRGGVLGTGPGIAVDIGDAARPVIPQVPLPAGAASVVQAALSSKLTCTVTTSAQVYCWGNPDFLPYTAPRQEEDRRRRAQGTEPGTDASQAPLVQFGTNATVTHLWAGFDDAMCAAFSEGSGTCWGVVPRDRTEFPRALESSPTFRVFQPLSMSVQLTLSPGGKLLPGFTAPSASMNCAIVQPPGAHTSHVLWCWGRGAALAQNVAEARNQDPDDIQPRDAAPLDFGSVPAGWEVRQVASGSSHACAILAPVPLSTPGYSASTHGMAVRCWGENKGCALGLLDVSNQVVIGDNSSLSLAEWPNTIEVGYPSATPSVSPTMTSSPSVSPTASGSPSTTASPSGSPSVSGSPTGSVSPPATQSSTGSPSPSVSPSPGEAIAAAALSSTGDDSSFSAGPIVAVTLVAMVVVGAAATALCRRRSAPAPRSARPLPPPPASAQV